MIYQINSKVRILPVQSIINIKMMVIFSTEIFGPVHGDTSYYEKSGDKPTSFHDK